MALDITKKVSLEELGDNWKDCYIEFKRLLYKEVKKIMQSNKGDLTDEQGIAILDEGIAKLKELFVGGYGIKDGARKELVVDDIDCLPLETIVKCYQAVQGEISPKQ